MSIPVKNNVRVVTNGRPSKLEVSRLVQSPPTTIPMLEDIFWFEFWILFKRWL